MKKASLGIARRLCFFCALIGLSRAQAQDQEVAGPPLSPAFENLVPPVSASFQLHQFFSILTTLPAKSSTHTLVSKMLTPVRNQQDRGTCTVFSITALVENLMIRDFGASQKIDLSEEWLAYLAFRDKVIEGSWSPMNLVLVYNYGHLNESEWNYRGEVWKNPQGVAGKTCKKLTGAELTSCLLAHRDPRLLGATEQELSSPGSAVFDPEYLKFRKSADNFRSKYMDPLKINQDIYVPTIDEAKALLAQGIPVVMDGNFYYGSWNHPQAEQLGIGRNPFAWEKGIVGYPELGSMDRNVSALHPAGHSVVLVGYDDNYEIENELKMQDGSYKKFKYKGVYFFRNSWGTSSFGLKTEVDGNGHPGYGVMAQKYAHEFGQFYKFLTL